MKLRNFFKTLAAAFAAPVATIKCPQTGISLTNVFPEKREELPGLIATAADGDLYVILGECEGEIMWQGEVINNFRMNKWWGYKLADPFQEKQLLVIDKYELDAARYGVRFFKKVE